MAWFYLFLAGLSEIIWAVGLKYCNGLKITLPLIIVTIATISSMFFLSLAMKEIPIGTSYTIWTGIGIVGVSIYGILFFHESTDPLRVFFLAIILLGIIGLQITTINK